VLFPRRTAVVILAVVALAAGCRRSGAAPPASAGHPQASTGPVYVTEADPAWIPVEALLQPADVGPGYHLENEHTGQPGSDPTWSFGVDCPAYAGPAVNHFQQYTFQRFHNVVPDGNPPGGQGMVRAETRRYPTATAAVVVADARSVVDGCPTYTSGVGAGVPGDDPVGATRDPGHVVFTWAVVGQGFAGDDSLLVRKETVVIDDRTGQRVRYNGEDSSLTSYAVVRVADLVTVLQSETADPAPLRGLAVSAAARMCVAAIPRCPAGTGG